MAIDNISGGAAAVVAVQRGSTLQADGQVAGLTEQPELLAGMEGAEDGTAQTAARLQLLQTLNRVTCCSLLPPADKRGNRYRYMCVRTKIQTSDLVTKKYN